MTARNVWGVIIIVVGVLMILGSAKDYSDLNSTRQGLSMMVGGKFYYNARIKEVFRKEERKEIVGVLFGVAMAIGGTMLIKEKNKKEFCSFKSISQPEEEIYADDIEIKEKE